MELNSLYQEVILDHYKRPHHKGLAVGDIQVHHINPSCGDEITLSLKLAGSKIASITWDGVGLVRHWFDMTTTGFDIYKFIGDWRCKFRMKRISYC